MNINFSHHKHGNELLELLASGDKYMSADTLLQQLQISRRSLFYLIEKVNEELDNHAEFPIANVKNLGYFLPAETVVALQQHATTDPAKITANTPHDRQVLMAFIIMNSSATSLIQLEQRFRISKNTVIRDIKKMSTALTKYRLTIRNTSNGKVITGQRADQRRWVYDHIDNLQQLITTPTFATDDINQQLVLFESITGKYLTDNAKNRLLLFLQWYLQLVQTKTQQLTATTNPPKASLELTWAQSFLQDYQIDNRYKADFLTKLINSTQFSHANWDDPLMKELKPIAVRMIASFNYLAGAHVSAKAIADGLTVHLLSTYYRVMYAMPYKYADLKMIMTDYHHTFEITKKVVAPFEKTIGHQLTDDEVALITIYFGGAIREQKDNAERGDEVLVVCSSGIGTSRLLLKQLKTRYRGIQFSNPMNILQYENSNLTNVKLVISTIQLLPRNAVPVITVSAFPSDLEWKIIDSGIIKADLVNSADLQIFNVETLLDIVDNFAMVTDPNGLKDAFNDYLKQLTQAPIMDTSKNTETELAKMLPVDHIGFITHPDSWQAAVRTALEPLVADYTVEKKYVDQIVNLTLKNGPYMVVGSGVMLAHASSRDGVNALGATLFVLDHPIDVITADKPVQLIIGLAPIDQEKHLTFLSELMTKLQDNHWLAGLLQQPGRSGLINYLTHNDD